MCMWAQQRGLGCDKTVRSRELYFGFDLSLLISWVFCWTEEISQCATGFSLLWAPSLQVLLYLQDFIVNKVAKKKPTWNLLPLCTVGSKAFQLRWHGGWHSRKSSLCHEQYLWGQACFGRTNIRDRVVYQWAKAVATATYRQFIVTAVSNQNATASCFHCGSTQKKTAGRGQHM